MKRGANVLSTSILVLFPEELNNPEVSFVYYFDHSVSFSHSVSILCPKEVINQTKSNSGFAEERIRLVSFNVCMPEIEFNEIESMPACL